MNKKVSVLTISVLLFCLIPLVSANSETFDVPKFGTQIGTVDLKQGDYITGYVTVPRGSDTADPFTLPDSIIFEITAPNGNILKDCNVDRYIGVDNYTGVYSENFFFSAPATGTYIFTFENTLFSNSSKTVTLNYTITPRELISKGIIEGVTGLGSGDYSHRWSRFSRRRCL